MSETAERPRKTRPEKRPLDVATKRLLVTLERAVLLQQGGQKPDCKRVRGEKVEAPSVDSLFKEFSHKRGERYRMIVGLDGQIEDFFNWGR